MSAVSSQPAPALRIAPNRHPVAPSDHPPLTASAAVQEKKTKIFCTMGPAVRARICV